MWSHKIYNKLESKLGTDSTKVKSKKRQASPSFFITDKHVDHCKQDLKSIAISKGNSKKSKYV